MMEKKRKSSAGTSKLEKKLTKEQMQLAILKKKECDAKALKIVERLLEPDVDPTWLVENLSDINKCHMKDVIEERAIVKLCGYVLCQKPLTVVYNQRYHISLKDKKVYDITERKNFCSSICFGASNYLLEQMQTSPLWLREYEKIPKFKIFHKEKHGIDTSHIDTHGKEIDVAAVGNTDQQGARQNVESRDSTSNQDGPPQVEAEKETSGCFENFVLQAVQNFELKDVKTTVDETIDETIVSFDNQENDRKQVKNMKNVKTTKEANGKELQIDGESQAHAQNCKKDLTMKNKIKSEVAVISSIDAMEKDENILVDDDDIIEQCVYLIENDTNDLSNECSNNLKKNQTDGEAMIEKSSYPVDDKYNKCVSRDKTVEKDVEIDQLGHDDLTSKAAKKMKQKACKKLVDVNLAARVEDSFHEWVTDETVDYLFGDESVKKKVVNTIQIQENHRILCGKLDRLQVQEEREDAAILGRTASKPAPHFAVLKEEGQKLDLKVRAFFNGKTSFEEPPKFDDDKEAPENVDTFLPLTADIHGPQILRRKIFLEKLDQVLAELLGTLAGNNDVYARASLNYSSVRCMAVKALVHTFSLSAKNIIFKTAEWTLVGLVIIKMLSLSDPYLASLLETKQANMYISMILTAYKLNSDYPSLLVSSFNPNMNPR